MRRTFAILKTGFGGSVYSTRNLTQAATCNRPTKSYATTATKPAAACWNCQKRVEHMICADCGCLQDVNSNVNYFELLQFPTKFSLQSQELTQRFRQLQARVHPDKYSNKTSREQTNSADWSSLVNKAYKTLSAPVERGRYLLQLAGEQLPQDNSALNTAFLMAMMDRNEQVEEAPDGATLERLNEQLNNELQENTLKLTGLFEANDLAAVKQTLVEMRYLHSIQNSIKKKQQQLMGSLPPSD